MRALRSADTSNLGLDTMISFEYYIRMTHVVIFATISQKNPRICRLRDILGTRTSNAAMQPATGAWLSQSSPKNCRFYNSNNIAEVR